MDYNFQQKLAADGVNYGTVLLRLHGSVGGTRHVFVNLRGNNNGLVFPPIGGKIVNPFKGTAKVYAGDLCEYSYTNKMVKILKTYKVAAAATNSADEIYIERDGFKHIPFVGDVLMKAPTAVSGTGTAKTVTAVQSTTSGGKDVWKITLDATLGVALVAGDVLVEAEAAGSGKKMMVQNPNAFFATDADFKYEPATGDADVDGARYMYTPCLANEDTKMFISKMSPVPSCVLALNKSKVDGWFNL